MPRYTARERRERYLREYQFQKKTGKQFFPVRDPARHDREPVLPAADHRPGDPLALGVRPGARLADRRALGRHARRRLRVPGRPWRGGVRPAAGVVLLLPLRAAAHLQDAGAAPVRDGDHPDAVDDPADRWPFLDRRPERRISKRADRHGHRRLGADRAAGPDLVRLQGAGRRGGVDPSGRVRGAGQRLRHLPHAWPTPASARQARARTSTAPSRRSTWPTTASRTAAVACRRSAGR